MMTTLSVERILPTSCVILDVGGGPTTGEESAFQLRLRDKRASAPSKSSKVSEHFCIL